MKNKIRVIITAIIVFILAVTVGVNYLLKSGKILINFDIIEVSNKYTEYNVSYEKVKAASYYRITVHDSNSIKIFDNKFEDNRATFILKDLSYMEEYSLMVYAYDKSGEYRPANHAYKFTWEEPSINKDNIILNNDEDYILTLDGELSKKDYSIKIEEDNNVLLNEKISNNEYTISKDLYKDKSTKIDVKIISDNIIIDEISLFNNMNPISDIKIKTPSDEALIPLNDINLIYEGGDNALEYILNIYSDNKNLYQTNISKKNIVLSSDLFEYDKSYSFEIVAKYNDYEKKSKISVTIASKSKLKPVYISNNWKYVKKGTKIELKNDNFESKIYYTLNGDDPESMGILYNDPIEINEDTIIKTVAVKDNYYNSVVSTYNVHVGKKENLVVYLSPSNQGANIGVEETGFTNERDEMNDLSNYIEERLKNNGVKVIRNNSSGNINLWIQESIYAGADLHIAIHSNASSDHEAYGIETWINSEESATLSLASKLQNNLMDIYPYKDKENANRGVKYAQGALGEANDNYIPFGMLVEVAHHDNYDDALWIMQNKKLIGYNIADSILKYYQIID